jgi:hypothetical protein
MNDLELHDMPFRMVLRSGLNRLPEIHLGVRKAGQGHEGGATEILGNRHRLDRPGSYVSIMTSGPDRPRF